MSSESLNLTKKKLSGTQAFSNLIKVKDKISH